MHNISPRHKHLRCLVSTVMDEGRDSGRMTTHDAASLIVGARLSRTLLMSISHSQRLLVLYNLRCVVYCS